MLLVLVAADVDPGVVMCKVLLVVLLVLMAADADPGVVMCKVLLVVVGVGGC